MWTVWGTGGICENTVTHHDCLHLREMNMGQNHSDSLHGGQPGYEKMMKPTSVGITLVVAGD